MESLFLALLISAASSAAPAPSGGPAPLDLDCFRLMAELSEDSDPRIRGLGTVGAQYFLGRIDAAAPGFDFEQALARTIGDRDLLLRQCGEVLQAGGRDFRSIGDSLVARGRSEI